MRRKEISIQLSVEVTYDTSNTNIRKIKEAIRKAIDEIATCEDIEEIYRSEEV